jgi:hypothetical protein
MPSRMLGNRQRLSRRDDVGLSDDRALGDGGCDSRTAVSDNLDAPLGWLLVAIVTTGHIVSRRIAKSGAGTCRWSVPGRPLTAS